MKGIRITFRGEDFVAVSKSLVDLGVIFQVEPVEGGDQVPISTRRTQHPTTIQRGAQRKQRSAKIVGKAGTAERGGPQHIRSDAGSASDAAGRLRAMAERNRAATGRAPPTGGKVEVEDGGSSGTLKPSPAPVDSKS